MPQGVDETWSVLDGVGGEEGENRRKCRRPGRGRLGRKSARQRRMASHDHHWRLRLSSEKGRRLFRRSRPVRISTRAQSSTISTSAWLGGRSYVWPTCHCQGALPLTTFFGGLMMLTRMVRRTVVRSPPRSADAVRAGWSDHAHRVSARKHASAVRICRIDLRAICAVAMNPQSPGRPRRSHRIPRWLKDSACEAVRCRHPIPSHPMYSCYRIQSYRR